MLFLVFCKTNKTVRTIDIRYKIIKIKEPPSPTPIEIVTFDFFYYLSILFKKKEL